MVNHHEMIEPQDFKKLSILGPSQWWHSLKVDYSIYLYNMNSRFDEEKDGVRKQLRMR